jgi:hypothetical protein
MPKSHVPTNRRGDAKESEKVTVHVSSLRCAAQTATAADAFLSTSLLNYMCLHSGATEGRREGWERLPALPGWQWLYTGVDQEACISCAALHPPARSLRQGGRRARGRRKGRRRAGNTCSFASP